MGNEQTSTHADGAPNVPHPSSMPEGIAAPSTVTAQEAQEKKEEWFFRLSYGPQLGSAGYYIAGPRQECLGTAMRMAQKFNLELIEFRPFKNDDIKPIKRDREVFKYQYR